VIRVAGILLLIILLLGQAGPAYAQSGPTPTPPFVPARAAPDWDSMPDALGYVTWTVPQCGAGITDTTGSAPATTWSQPSSLFAWLAWNVQRIGMGITCWLAALTQHIVNVAALAANLIIGLLNYLWRLGLFAWLYGSWLAVEWGTYLYEGIRDLLWDLRDGWQIVAAWFGQLAQAGADVLAFVGQWIILIGQVVMAGMNWLAWLGSRLMVVPMIW
jgi:hypothetical protein